MRKNAAVATAELEDSALALTGICVVERAPRRAQAGFGVRAGLPNRTCRLWLTLL